MTVAMNPITRRSLAPTGVTVQPAVAQRSTLGLGVLVTLPGNRANAVSAKALAASIGQVFQQVVANMPVIAKYPDCQTWWHGVPTEDGRALHIRLYLETGSDETALVIRDAWPYDDLIPDVLMREVEFDSPRRIDKCLLWRTETVQIGNVEPESVFTLVDNGTLSYRLYTIAERYWA